jgi:hypothetical protein
MNQAPDPMSDPPASKPPGRAPSKTAPEACRPSQEDGQSGQPAPENEAGDPVGDGHSDADWAERLPPN